MTQQQLVLLVLSLGSIAALSIFPVFRDWWRAIGRYPYESFLLIALFIGILFLGGERTAGSSELLDPLRLARMVVFVSITGLAWLRILLASSRAIAGNRVLLMMMLYGLTAMVTAFYSVYPLLSLWKGFEVVTHVSVAAAIARQAVTVEDTNRLMGLGWLLLTYLIASFLWGAALYPDDAFRPFLDNTGAVASEGAFGSGLRGTFPKMHLNSVTQIGAIVSIAAVAYLASLTKQGYTRPLMFLLAAALTVVLFGHSRTSIIAFAVASLVLSIYLKSRALRLWIFSMVVIGGISILLSDVVTDYLLRGQTTDQLAGWNGRISMWTAILNAISESPIYGYGFYAGTRVLFGVPGADNTYLTVIMGGGTILLTIFVIPIATLMRQLFITRPSRVAAARQSEYRLLWTQATGLFILLFMRSISGPSFDANHFNLILFLLCAVAAASLVRHRSTTGTMSEAPSAANPTIAPDNGRILARRKTQKASQA